MPIEFGQCSTILLLKQTVVPVNRHEYIFHYFLAEIVFRASVGMTDDVFLHPFQMCFHFLSGK